MSKKQIVMVAVLAGVVALLPACWPFGKKIETETKQNKDLYVINVLDKSSFEDCKIAGSINVPFEEVESFAKDLDRKTQVVVYCANYMCTASGAAAQKLKEMGFENVWAYEGGTAEWYQMGLKDEGKFPVEGTCKASYLAAANEKPAQTEATTVSAISAEELREKMVTFGLMTVAQAPAQSEEGSQQAAA
jgi:rhodanese-related sulfurtransferase